MSTALHEVLGDTPQSEKLPGRPEMVKNAAGGYVFPVDRWTRLDRWLVLGTEGGTYYADQRKHTLDNVEALASCIRADGPETVARIREVSMTNRAPRNDQAIFGLAAALSDGDAKTRAAACAAFPEIIRIGTHMLMFMSFYSRMKGGLGRRVRSAIADWYARSADPSGRGYVGLQVVKYQSRHGWTHRDVLRQVHPRTTDAKLRELFEWVCRPKGYEVNENTPGWVTAWLRLQDAPDVAEAVAAIEDHPFLTWEMVPDAYRKPEVWQALLDKGMPLGALIRQLPTLTRHGLLGPDRLGASGETVSRSANTADVVTALGDRHLLHKARIHPMNVLLASMSYRSGRGRSTTWDPVPEVVDALDEAFTLAFPEAPTIRSRLLLGVDVSSSMSGYFASVGSTTLSAAKAAAAMALCLVRNSVSAQAFGFSAKGTRNAIYGAQNMLKPLNITKRSTLAEVEMSTEAMNFGGTDCALPMMHAIENNLAVDTFVVLTDNESWAGPVHASEALRRYRRHSGIAAKMVVVAFTATRYSIADPDDAGMLDVVGFDTAVPRLVEDFAG